MATITLDLTAFDIDTRITIMAALATEIVNKADNACEDVLRAWRAESDLRETEAMEGYDVDEALTHLDRAKTEIDECYTWQADCAFLWSYVVELRGCYREQLDQMEEHYTNALRGLSRVQESAELARRAIGQARRCL
jgi:hypothetical protein